MSRWVIARAKKVAFENSPRMRCAPLYFPTRLSPERVHPAKAVPDSLEPHGGLVLENEACTRIEVRSGRAGKIVHKEDRDHGRSGLAFMVPSRVIHSSLETRWVEASRLSEVPEEGDLGTRERRRLISAAGGLLRSLYDVGIVWLACYPRNLLPFFRALPEWPPRSIREVAT